MGLFGGKKTTYRDFSYTRLIEDDYLPNVIGQAITKYVLDKDNTESLTDLMIEYAWKSIALKWNAAYRYAVKPGKYTYGVPKVSTLAESDFTDATSLNTVLENLSGHTDLSYVYSKFGSSNYRHIMWQLLVSTYNYSPTTNILGAITTSLRVTAYLQDAQIRYIPDVLVKADPVMLEHWGYPPTSGKTNNRAQDFSRPDTPDGSSSTGSNYTYVTYEALYTGITRNVVVTTTAVKKTVRTPNGSGGYNDVVTNTSSDSTATSVDMAGKTLPTNIVSQTETTGTSTTSTVTDPTSTTTVTNPTTGVITITATTVSRKTTATPLTWDVVAYFNMTFGSYDIDWSDALIDTTTVLDDRDSGNYDPDAVMVPSGESTATDYDYFQVCFTYPDSSGVLHVNYFTYQYGSGQYPDLDGITSSTVTDFGEHYPRIYMRLAGDKVATDALSGTDAYKTSVKLCNKLDMDWIEMNDEIYSSLSSLNKIRDVYITQAVPAITSTPIEQEYLFNYFKTLYNLRPAFTVDDYRKVVSLTSVSSGSKPENDYDTWNAHVGSVVQSTDGTSAVQNNMTALGYREITGVIGVVGFTASGYATDGKELIRYSERDSSGVVTYTYGTAPISYHYYRLQTTETTYQEVRVYSLIGGVLVGGKMQTKSKDDEQVMVPLDRAFRKMFSPHQRETLYARATYMVIGTEYTVKTKWYQTGLFKAVVIVVAVALSWVTGGSSLTLIGVVTAVATAVGAAIVFSLLSKYVFSKLGGVFAVIAVVIAVAVAIYTGYVYLANTPGVFNLTAVQLMQASNYAFQASMSASQGEVAKAQQKLARLEDEINSKTDELKAAQDELANPYNTIEDSIFNSMGMFQVGEPAQDFFARTLNTNIGAAALSVVDIYIAVNTSLPTPVSIFADMQQNMNKPFELDTGLNDL